MIMSVISRTLMVLSQILAGDPREPQFKNSIMTLAADAAILAAEGISRKSCHRLPGNTRRNSSSHILPSQDAQTLSTESHQKEQ